VEELRKGKRQMKLFSDEKCEAQLDNGDSFFDHTSQVCTMHEPKTDTVSGDSVPVIFF
jgi:hypothetical protein